MFLIKSLTSDLPKSHSDHITLYYFQKNINTVKNKDHRSGKICLGVSAVPMAVAERLGISEDEIEDILKLAGEEVKDEE